MFAIRTRECQVFKKLATRKPTLTHQANAYFQELPALNINLTPS